MTTLGIYKTNDQILVHSEDQKGQNKLQLKFDGKFNFREKDSYKEFKDFIRSFGPCRVAILSSGKNTPIECFTTSQWLEFQITIVAWDPTYFDALLKKHKNTYASQVEALCKLTHSLSLISLLFSKQAIPSAARIDRSLKNLTSWKLRTQKAHFYIIDKNHLQYYFSYMRDYIKNSERKTRFCALWCFTLLVALLLGHISSLNTNFLKYLLHSRNLFPLYEHPGLIKLLTAQIALIAWHIPKQTVRFISEVSLLIILFLSGMFNSILCQYISDGTSLNPLLLKYLPHSITPHPAFISAGFFLLTWAVIITLCISHFSSYDRTDNPSYNPSEGFFFLFETLILGAFFSVLLYCSTCPHLIYQSILLSAAMFGFFAAQSAKTNRKNGIWMNKLMQSSLCAIVCLVISSLFFADTLGDLKFLATVAGTIAFTVTCLPFLITKYSTIVLPCLIFAFCLTCPFLLYWLYEAISTTLLS